MSDSNHTFSVLYVDDDVTLHKSTKQYPEYTGDFAVDTVSSGREGLKQLNTGTYDVVACSNRLPEHLIHL